MHNKKTRESTEIMTDRYLEFAWEGACKSIVLLKND
jgi:hypothetical protein